MFYTYLRTRIWGLGFYFPRKSQEVKHAVLVSLLSFSIRGKTENHNHRKLTNLTTWTTALSNSMKLWAILCRATQDKWVMVEWSDRMWSTGEGDGKPLQYSCLENPMNSMKRQKDRTLKDELLRSAGAQYATGDQWRNNSRKNEGMEPKQNNTQLWMWLVIEARSNAVKSNIAWEPGMLGPWIKANWKWSNRRWQGWMWTF